MPDGDLGRCAGIYKQNACDAKTDSGRMRHGDKRGNDRRADQQGKASKALHEKRTDVERGPQIDESGQR